MKKAIAMYIIMKLLKISAKKKVLKERKNKLYDSQRNKEYVNRFLTRNTANEKIVDKWITSLKY